MPGDEYFEFARMSREEHHHSERDHGNAARNGDQESPGEPLARVKRSRRRRGMPRCPLCGSDDVGRLVFGLLTPDGMDKVIGRGDIPAGCIVMTDGPAYGCHRCGIEFDAELRALS